MRRFFYIAFLSTLLLLPASMFAQEGQAVVNGTVRDETGQPVAGAVVMLEGNTAHAAFTDMSGRYRLSFPADTKAPRLNVSCMGFHAQTVAVEGRTTINFDLRPDTEQLEEVVVVGYGSMRRSDLTGSVTSIRIDENDAAQSTSLDKLLQGRAAGVQVISNTAAPDGGVSIRIRGLSTFNGSGEPLYVVDGVILNTSNTAAVMSKGTDNGGSDEATNGLMGINPQDIANIEVLKDASATAIYGSQGANGVVLITTKTANRDKPTITFNAGLDISRAYKKMPVMSFDEYVEYLEAMASSLLTSIYTDPTNHDGLLVEPINWQDYVLRTGISRRYFFSIAGKQGKTSTRLSFGYTNSEGIVKTTGFDNYTLRFNMSRPIRKKVNVGLNFGLSYVDSRLTQGASYGRLNAATSMMRSMLMTRPYRHLSATGDDDDPEDADDGGISFRAGPDRWFDDFENKREELRITPNAFVRVKLASWLHYKIQVGGDYRISEQKKWKSNRINTGAEGSVAGVSHLDRLSFNMDNLFEFNKKFGRKHSLSGTAGMTLSGGSTFTYGQQGWNIEQRLGQTASINTAPYASYSFSESANQLMSWLARAVYSYRDRYVLTATYRFDGSSRFSGRNRWAQFPSFAAAWRISQEPWFRVPAVSSAKLRLGWGRVGSQSVSSYQTVPGYSRLSYADHTATNTAGLNVGLYPSNLANPKLKWETTEQVNVGLDLGLWKGRFTFSVDAYDKMTYDLLQSKTIAGSYGFSSMWANIGTIQNRGLEFSVETTPVKTKTFELNLSGNISFNRNKIVEIGAAGERDDIYLASGKKVSRVYFPGATVGSSGILQTYINIFAEGEPIGCFYVLPTDGLVQEGELGVPLGESGTPRLPGAINYIDTNGDGYISDLDRVVYGNPNPDFTYGFNVNLTYRRLSFSAAFTGSYGNDIYNVNSMMEGNITSTSYNHYVDAFRKAWTAENPNTKYPALNRLESADLRWASDCFVEDGSYLRVSNLTLSYNIPLKKGGFLRRLSLGVTASNLWFWTRYTGYDPDVNSYGSIMRIGADMGSYPGARTFKCDVKFTF